MKVEKFEVISKSAGTMSRKSLFFTHIVLTATAYPYSTSAQVLSTSLINFHFLWQVSECSLLSQHRKLNRMQSDSACRSQKRTDRKRWKRELASMEWKTVLM